MGLISRVSSRTYRESKTKTESVMNSIKTDGKRKAIPNAGPAFLTGNPVWKKYIMQGENKWLVQRRPLYWTTRKLAVAAMIPNWALCYAILYGEDQFNAVFNTNQTTGCYSIAYGCVSTYCLGYLAFCCW